LDEDEDYSGELDFNAEAVINFSDFIKFRSRVGRTLSFD